MSNWITVKGRHIDLDDPHNPVTGDGSFEDLKKESSKTTNNKESSKVNTNTEHISKNTSAKPKTAEMIEQRAAKADKLKRLGANVSKDGLVTLYHATPKENINAIKKDGFKGSNAPVNGGVVEKIKPRSFFGFQKEWVEKTWSNNGNYEVLEVKIPAEYLHQAGNNTQEVFVEGNIKNENGVWIPDTLPTSTAWDRITVKRFKKGN